MICSTRGFGHPVTDAGGNVARMISADGDVVAQRPAHGAHEVEQPGMWLDGAQRGHVDRSVLAHPPQVVPREIDDHHVLGAILLARLELARRSEAVPLIGRVSIARPSRRRKRSGDAETTAMSSSMSKAPCGAGCALGDATIERDGVAGLRRLEPSREVHLIAVAGAQVVEDRSTPLCPQRAVEARRPPAELPAAPRAGERRRGGSRRSAKRTRCRSGSPRSPMADRSGTRSDRPAEVVGEVARPPAVPRPSRRSKASGPRAADDVDGIGRQERPGPVPDDRERRGLPSAPHRVPSAGPTRAVTL